MFTRAFDRRIRIAAGVIGFSLLVGASFGTYALWPANLETGYAPQQPIEFSHKIMAGDFKIDCRYCHSFAEKGAHATLPTVESCMGCHDVIQPRNPDGSLRPGIVQLLDYWKKKEPIPWVKVNDLADFVYFDHSRHLAGGVTCQECHGPVETMDRVRRENSLKMGWCLACHTQPPPPGAPPHQTTRAPINCNTCHR